MVAFVNTLLLLFVKPRSKIYDYRKYMNIIQTRIIFFVNLKISTRFIYFDIQKHEKRNYLKKWISSPIWIDQEFFYILWIYRLIAANFWKNWNFDAVAKKYMTRGSQPFWKSKNSRWPGYTSQRASKIGSFESFC